MHAFDRQTDRRTDRILIARPRLHSMQRGKNGQLFNRDTEIRSPYLNILCICLENQHSTLKTPINLSMTIIIAYISPKMHNQLRTGIQHVCRIPETPSLLF